MPVEEGELIDEPLVREDPVCELPAEDPVFMLPDDVEPPVDEPEPPAVPDCAATASGSDAARAVIKRVRRDEFISIGLRLRRENDGSPLGCDTRGVHRPAT